CAAFICSYGFRYRLIEEKDRQKIPGTSTFSVFLVSEVRFSVSPDTAPGWVQHWRLASALSGQSPHSWGSLYRNTASPPAADNGPEAAQRLHERFAAAAIESEFLQHCDP